MAVHKGRVDDILLLFTNRSIPAMEGPIDFHARFTIPPGPPGFLTRLEVDGSFEISGARFTNPKIQTPITLLSASAAGRSKQDQEAAPTSVSGDIRASVSDRAGLASLTKIVFDAPGVRVNLNGTFALNDKAINLDGLLQTSGKLSDATSGVKALMLKLLGPLWSKKPSVQAIPLHIGGDASHPTLRVKLKGS